jgi:UDP-glucose 4-epimerase
LVVSNYWEGKKVALFGGASLIGTHLANELMSRGAIVRMSDDLSAGRLSNIQELINRGMEFYKMDLRHYSNAFAGVIGCDVVFHLAAQHGGRGYVASHKVELYDNLALDTTIFRACSDAKVGKVIFSSSACAYPIDLQTRSDDLLYLSEDMIDYGNMKQADGAYGTEKLLGEMILDAYIERGDFKGCSTRSFTVYGPLMGETHAIAALIAKTMIKQDPFEIWADKDNLQIRNWTTVWDNVAGALLAAEHLERGAINVGIEDRLTPVDACNLIWENMGWMPKEIDFHPEKPIGPRNRVANSTALKALGWKPKYTFEQGLRKTIDWYVSTHDTESLKKDLERKLTER